MKHRIFALGIIAMLVIAMCPAAALAADTWDGSVDTTWYNAAGTEFTLTTGTQLAGLAKLVNEGAAESGDAPVDFNGTTITLGDDISLGGNQWSPIGINAIHEFNGTFDGDGHTVSGLAIGTSGTPSTLAFSGLFGTAGTSSELKNLNVDGNIYTTGVAGMLVGIAKSIANCTVSGSVTGGNESGGLTGAAFGSITNCRSGAAVTGGRDTGGLVGRYTLGSSGEFHGCCATGDVTLTSSTYYSCGGLVGHLTAGVDVTDCYATGDVFAEREGTEAGGLFGYYYASVSGLTVSGCWATGDVTGGESCLAGGFAGIIEIGTLEKCFATGSVTADNGSSVGGLAGESSGEVHNCFASGDVSGGAASAIGGLVGESFYPIAACYAAGGVSGASTSLNGSSVGGLVGLNRSEVSGSYARGAVSDSEPSASVGGLVGYNSGGTSPVNTSYFDTRGTGQANASGGGDAVSVTGLDTAVMTGTGASTNMTDLDFTDDYTAKANDSKWYYPQLKVFAESSDPAVRAASLASVTMTPFTVAFDVDGGSAVDSEYGYYTAVSQPAAPTWDGYAFGGWYMDGGFTTAYNFLDLVTADITLHAKWTPYTYTVEYDANGGSGTTASSAHIYGVAKTLTANGFSREYYTFAGWAESATGAVAYSDGQSVSSLTTVNGATVTLYARWTAQPELISDVPSGKIYTGGRIVLTPNIDGGTWDWDHSFFTATFNSPATFTALKAGTSTITYTVDGISTTYDVTIEVSKLPSTGQDDTIIYALAVLAALALGAGIFMGIRMSLKRT